MFVMVAVKSKVNVCIVRARICAYISPDIPSSPVCLTYVQQREHDALEHRPGLVHRALQALVIMHVELAVILVFSHAFTRKADVFPNCVQQHHLEEQTRLWRLHLRGEYTRRSMASLRRPVLRVCEREDSRPLRQGRNDFEWFGQGPGLVPGQHLADSGKL